MPVSRMTMFAMLLIRTPDTRDFIAILRSVMGREWMVLLMSHRIRPSYIAISAGAVLMVSIPPGVEKAAQRARVDD